MKSISIASYGSADVLQMIEQPTPELKADEILVKNEYVGLNFIDIYFREGLYKAAQLPFIPGFEGAGEVVAVGDAVDNIYEGLRVGYVACQTGAYAEFTVVKASDAIVLPVDIDNKTAAAALLQGLTAHYLTHSTKPLNKNDKVLIHAGAGGVGQLLIQMAKQRGAYVFTTVSSEDKQKIVQALGADQVINYKKEDFLQAIKAATNDEGVDVVYDAIGKDTYEKSLQSLKIRGMFVTYGQASGPIPNIDPLLLGAKSLYLTRPKLWNYLTTQAEKEQRANDLFNSIINKQLTLDISAVFPLTKVKEAQELLQSRKSTGKILLKI